MNLQSFDKIATNVEVLIYIYKQLSFEDQLRLAQVSDDLASAFECYIWKETYQTLTINPNEDDFVVTNETDANRLRVNPIEFQEFLRLQANKARVLTIRRGVPIDVRPFRNLTSLCYRNMTVPMPHLKFIAENCPQLESIHFYCCTDEESTFIVIGENWNVETLLQMKNLKRLSLENAIHVSINYRDFREIVSKLNLEYMLLKAGLEPEPDFVDKERKTPEHVKLKELEIETTFDPEAWPNNFNLYLSNFQNLVKLTVKLYDLVSDKILRIMSENLFKLEMLYIQFTTFENVQTFSVPPVLTELSLYNCKGLTQDNLKQLLTQLKITKFSSITNDYIGEFQDFPISPFIETLNFADVHTHKFKSAFDGNKNLKDLTWYDEFYIFDDLSIATDIPLENCINLETLNMQAGFMPLSIIHQLKSLHKLIIPQSMPRLNWHYIMTVLKHPNLQEFVMNKFCPPRCLKKATDVPDCGFATNVKILKITQDVFEMAFEFWLDLFQRNVDLKLIVCEFFRSGEFLQKIVNHKKFPRHIKRIDVCCFNLACHELRNNFDATMQKLNDDTNHLRFEYNDDLYRVILCR